MRTLYWAIYLPWEMFLEIIEIYLSSFNTILPLFHAPTLLQTVRSRYQSLHTRSPIDWGVINVVLALAHYTHCLGGRAPIGDTKTYLSNAQSLLTEIIMRDKMDYPLTPHPVAPHLSPDFNHFN
ncbi:hypothetical protein F5X98DRAFT_339567 [Xylaria grammica]|nr:hypothetical protein F5X98DRAFT_339567 [Xylaria grammica]